MLHRAETIKGTPTVLVHHDSLDSLLSHTTRPAAWRCELESQRPDTAKGWHGTPDFAAALDLARNGWSEGRDQLASMRETLSARTTYATRPSDVWDVAGAYPIAAVAAAGDPCSMVDMVPEDNRRRPIIRLAIQSFVSSVYGTRQITNFGAAMCSLIDAIEASGARVEIESCLAVRCGRDDKAELVVRTMLKRAEDHVEIDRLAFCLTHPSFFRRIMFAAFEQEPTLENAFAGNYGLPNLPLCMKNWLDSDQIFLAGPNLFAPSSPQLASPEAALAALELIVRVSLADYGVNLPALWGANY